MATGSRAAGLKTMHIMEHSNPAVEFIFTELEAGLTFAKLALTARKGDKNKVARNRKNARKAYDSVLHFRQRASLSEDEVVEYEAGLVELKKVLVALGEAV